MFVTNIKWNISFSWSACLKDFQRQMMCSRASCRQNGFSFYIIKWKFKKKLLPPSRGRSILKIPLTQHSTYRPHLINQSTNFIWMELHKRCKTKCFIEIKQATQYIKILHAGKKKRSSSSSNLPPATNRHTHTPTHTPSHTPTYEIHPLSANYEIIKQAQTRMQLCWNCE